MTEMKEESPKAIFYALAANFGIAVFKFAAATFTQSGSMFAEAIHSTADCGNQLLLLFGLREARKPPSPLHPHGRGPRDQLLFAAGRAAAVLRRRRVLGV